MKNARLAARGNNIFFITWTGRVALPICSIPHLEVGKGAVVSNTPFDMCLLTKGLLSATCSEVVICPCRNWSTPTLHFTFSWEQMLGLLTQGTASCSVASSCSFHCKYQIFEAFFKALRPWSYVTTRDSQALIWKKCCREKLKQMKTRKQISR